MTKAEVRTLVTQLFQEAETCTDHYDPLLSPPLVEIREKLITSIEAKYAVDPGRPT